MCKRVSNHFRFSARNTQIRLCLFYSWLLYRIGITYDIYILYFHAGYDWFSILVMFKKDQEIVYSILILIGNWFQSVWTCLLKAWLLVRLQMFHIIFKERLKNNDGKHFRELCKKIIKFYIFCTALFYLWYLNFLDAIKKVESSPDFVCKKTMNDI